MIAGPLDMWQELLAPGQFAPGPQADGTTFVADLPDGHQIFLPIRVLPGGTDRAVASLILNQASFSVLDAFADTLTQAVLEYAPDIVVGLPTLGLPLAEGISRRLGQKRMVALSTSRKFWYDESLSEPLNSITSPGQEKTLFMDPRMLPLLTGARVLLVDDVLSTGTSIMAAVRLLARAGIIPTAIAGAMLQGTGWRTMLSAYDPGLPVIGAIRTPVMIRRGDGWVEIP